MRLLAVDSETHLIRPGLLAPPPVCFSFAQPDDRWLHDKERGASAFEYALDQAMGPTHLVLHNAAFDLAVLCAYRPRNIPKVFAALEEGRVHDTMIRQQLIDIAKGELNWPREDGTKGYHLADLVLHYIGRDRRHEKEDENAWRMRYAELEDKPIHEWPEEARRYALDDASDTLKVYLLQEKFHGDEIRDEAAQVRAAWALHLMSCWGIRTDGDAVAELERALTSEAEENFTKLQAAGFYKTRRATKKEVEDGQVDEWEDTPKGARPLVYARDMAAISARVDKAYAGAPPKTKKDRVSTDKDTLLRSGDAELGLLAEAGGVEKILTTYLPVLKQGVTQPINARFNVLVNSGRTSCSKPNLQNLPTGRRVSGTRECFVPRPGNLFCSVDYDTLELRAFAQVQLWLFEHSAMADAIKAGKDLHLALAAESLHITYDEAKARKKAKDPQIKKRRDCMKAANFGLMGGLGIETFIEFARATYKVELDAKEAWEIKQLWLATWPEAELYFKFISDTVGQGGATITQFVSKRLRGDVGFCDGCNTYVQGLAADGAKAALFAVARECYLDRGTDLYGVRPVAFIHDEILAEMRAEIAHEAALRMAKVMCDEMAKYIPDVPITATPALMTRWWKDAEAAHNEDGRLVPWEPEQARAA